MEKYWLTPLGDLMAIVDCGYVDNGRGVPTGKGSYSSWREVRIQQCDLACVLHSNHILALTVCYILT